MDIHLIKGHFNPKEALEIITQMVHVKIKFQESKINSSSNEEDIKMRENRIKSLQRELFDARKYIETQKGMIDISADIEL
jgi:hypothetical protein